MRLMKQYIFLLLLLFMVGCQRQTSYKIGVSQCSDDDWRALMNEEIRQEIMFHPEATVEIRSASDSNEKQIADIQYFLDNNFDIIIAAPNEADALTPIIKKAYQGGTPVLIFDRNINGDTFTAFQGADNIEIGAEAAEYAAGLLPQGGKIIELKGRPGSTPSKERSKGFEDEIAKNGHKLTIVGTAAANWNYDDAVKATDSLLTVHPDVDLIYAHNDRMALGASYVAGKKNLKPKIIGIDAAPEIGMKGVAEGKIDATFLYPTKGYQLIKTAMAILNGEEYERKLLMPATSPVDKSNVDLLLRQNEVLTEENGKLKSLKNEMEDYWSQHSSQTAILYSAIAILLLVCIVLFLVLRTFWQHKRHQAQLLEKNRQLEEQRDLEKDLNRRLEAATKSKLTFFTNVSHDLRTPLTLIAEPVDQVSNAENLLPEQKKLMKIADKNVKILHRLINQILDFRKYENDKLECHREEVEIGPIAREWGEAFMPYARKRYIDFKVEIDLPAGFSMALDLDKTERVVFNLLFNAFKFTAPKGKIQFKLSAEKHKLTLRVEDNGRGIPADKLKNIFSRFYKVDKIRPEGSGIGLSLAKAFVEVQGGEIQVESEEDKGTVFTVTIPITHTENQVSRQSREQSVDSAHTVADLLDEIETTEDLAVKIEGDSRPLMLIIDDNEDIRQLVSQMMQKDYNVITASGGKKGVKLATRYVPDIIICDVMMPDMDGMECCRLIKEEITTSHVPVLMLTACTMDEERAMGYESGADGYMSKPFKSEVLKARVESLINNRRKIRERFENGIKLSVSNSDRTEETGESRKKNIKSDREKEFITKVVEIIDEKMKDAELSVDTLAELMGMGRSQFYRKIKALTNFSPVELLRDMRLKRARQLLTTTDKTISEIAYEVGFSTPAYFTKCYREVYSETPSASRDKLKR